MDTFSGEVVFPELIDGKKKLHHLCVECGPFHLDYVSYLRADFSRFDNDSSLTWGELIFPSNANRQSITCVLSYRVVLWIASCK